MKDKFLILPRVALGVIILSHSAVLADSAHLAQVDSAANNYAVTNGALENAPPVLADIGLSDLDVAQKYFEAGDYDKAVAIGEKIGAKAAPETASKAYLIASEAMAAKIILGYYDKPNGPSKLARDFARKAVDLDDDNLDARFQYLVSFGLETQSTGVLKAWRKKMPTRMKAAIELMQERAPNDPRGYALLGAWHLGIVNKVGAKNAYSWYKASPETGRALYERSLGLADNDIIITSNYAASMILLDHQDYAEKLLSEVSNMQAVTAAETEVQTRMVKLLSFYEEPKKLRAAAKKFLNNERF